MQILIVDHDQKRLLDTSRILQSAGHRVLGAATGDECLRTAKAKRPDLILLEAALPDISGIDLARELKRDAELQHAYVVVLAAEGTPSAIQARAMESGADDCLPRTLASRELLARVEAMLRHRRTETALRAAVQQWKDAFDAIQDPVYVVDTANKILECNLALARFLGKPPSEVISRPCYELVHGTAEPVPTCLHQRVRETRQQETLVVPMRDRWLQVTVNPLLDEENNLVGTVHVLADVTERHQAEESWSQLRTELEQQVQDSRSAWTQASASLQAETAARQETAGALSLAQARLEKQAQEHLAILAKVQQALQAEIAARQQAEAALHQAQGEWEKQEAAQRAAIGQAEQALQAELTQRQQAEEALRQLHAELEQQTQEMQAALEMRQALEEEFGQSRLDWEGQTQQYHEALAKAAAALQEQVAARQAAEEALSQARAAVAQAEERFNQARAEWEKQATEYHAAAAQVEAAFGQARAEWVGHAQRYHQGLAKGAEALQEQVAERKRVEEALSQAQAELQQQAKEHRATVAQAEEAFRQARADWEERAEQQRAALAQAQRALQAEIEERQQTEGELSRARAEWEKQAGELQEALARVTQDLQGEVAQRRQVEEAFQQAQAEWQTQTEEHRAATSQTEKAFEFEIAQRQQTEEALSQLRAELEKQSQAMQAALAQAEEALQVETARHRQLEEEWSQARTEWQRQAEAYHAALAKAAEALQAEVAKRQQVEETLNEVRAEWEGQVGDYHAVLDKTREALRTEQEARQRAEQELAQARAQWEEQAHGYDQALANSAAALQQEAAERQQAQKTLAEETAAHQATLEALQSSETRFRLAVENVVDLIYAWDLESAEMEAFRDVHGKLYRDPSAFPKTVEEFQQMIHPQDRPQVQAALEGHLRSGEPFQAEYRVLHADGHVSHWIASGSAWRDEAGKAQKWIGTGRDVTATLQAQREKEELAAQLHKGQRMEAIALLAGGMAQEFNELLTGILGSAELGLAHLEPSYPGYNELAAIQRSARRAVTLTRRLSSIHRRQLAQSQVLDLNALLTGLGKVLRRVVGEQVDVELNLTPALKPVLADAAALEQALLILAENARAAMPQGGLLRTETAQVTLDEAYCQSHPGAWLGEYARLTVADNGPGFDEATKEHLFEPFFVAREGGQGRGLDLAELYGIVRQHGGWIEVYSQPGQGTRFEIYLPAHLPES